MPFGDILGAARIRIQADTSDVPGEIEGSIQGAADNAEDALTAAFRTAAANAADALSAVSDALDDLVIDAENEPLLESVAQAQSALEELAGESADIPLDADNVPLLEEVAEAEAAVAGLADESATIGLDADVSGLRASLASAVDAVQDAAAGIRDQFAGVGDQISANFGGAASTIRTVLVGAVGVATTAVAALGATALTAGVQFNVLSQQVSTGLTASLQSAEAARELTDEVIELNATAAFSRQSFLASTQQLVGFGVAAEDVSDTLNALQQAVVATGGGETEFRELTTVLAQVQARGRLVGEEMFQLAQRGLNLVDIIAETSGQSVAAVEAQMEAGEIGLDEITQALNQRFSGAVEGYADTWQGATGIILANIRNIGSALVEPFIELESGGAAVEAVNTVADAIVRIGDEVVPVVLPQVDGLADSFVSFAETVANVLDQISAEQIAGLIDSLEDIGPALAGAGAAFATVFGANLPIIDQFVSKSAALPVAIGAFLISIPEVRDALRGLFDAISPLIPVVVEVATIFAETLASAIGDIVEGVEPVLDAVGGLIDLFGQLPGPVQTVTLALAAFAAALRFAGPVGIAVTALGALATVVQEVTDSAAVMVPSVEEARLSLDRLAAGRTDEFTRQLRDLGDELREAQNFEPGVFDRLVDFTTFAGVPDQAERTAEALGSIREALEPLDPLLAGLVESGDIEEFDRQLALIAEGLNIDTDQLRDLAEDVLPQANTALEAFALAAEEDAATAAETLNTAISSLQAAPTAGGFVELSQAIRENQLSQEDLADAARVLGIPLQDLEEIAPRVADRFDSLREVFAETMPTIGDAVSQAVAEAEQAGNELTLSGINDALEEQLENARNFQQNLIAIAEEFGPQAAEIAAQGGAQVAAAIADGAGDQAEADRFRDALAGFQDLTTIGLDETAAAAALGGENVATSAIDGLVNNLAGVRQPFDENVAAPFLSEMRRLQRAGEEAATTAGGAAVTGLLAGVAPAADGVRNTFVDPVTGEIAAADLGSAAQGPVNDMLAVLSASFLQGETDTETFVDLVEGITSNADPTVGVEVDEPPRSDVFGVIDFIRSLLPDFLDGPVIEPLSPSQAAISGVLAGIQASLPDTIPGPTVRPRGEVQFFQHGGIVTTPELGVVAEAGPEVIIPLGAPFTHQFELLQDSGLLDNVIRALSAGAGAGVVSGLSPRETRVIGGPGRRDGGRDVTINVNGVTDPDEVARRISDLLGRGGL